MSDNTKNMNAATDRLRRGLRYASPAELRRRAGYVAKRLAARTVRPEYQTEVDNVYHCCVQRTGSQWIRHMLADARVFKHSGLRQGHPRDLAPEMAGARPLLRNQTGVRFPTGWIVSPIYIDRPAFRSMDKPERYRAFTVVRDPRDIVVSWYFSARYSHKTGGGGDGLAAIRRRLDEQPLAHGLLYSIERLQAMGLFDSLRSWAEFAPDDENLRVVRYEDLTGPNDAAVFAELFAHLDVRVPSHVLQELLRKHSFERLARRRRGEENKFSHLRKGVAGDWRNHFDDQVTAGFVTATGDLIDQLGYAHS